MNRREICVADPFEGEPCGPTTGTSACVGDSYCDLETARCRAPVLVSQGQACDTTRRLCPAGTDCRGVCVPRALEGEACTQTTQTTIPDGGPATCASGLCAGRCTGLRTENQFCRGPSQCAAGLGCNLVAAGNGRCLTWDAVRAQIDQQFVCP